MTPLCFAWITGTKFGAVLDMVSDRYVAEYLMTVNLVHCLGLTIVRSISPYSHLTARARRCTTLALMVVLAKFYVDHMVVIQLVIILDIGSHWVHMYR